MDNVSLKNNYAKVNTITPKIKNEYKLFNNNKIVECVVNSRISPDKVLAEYKLFCNTIPKKYYNLDKYVLLDIQKEKYIVDFIFRNKETGLKEIVKINRFSYVYKIDLEKASKSYPVLHVSKLKAYKKNFDEDQDYTVYEHDIDIILKYYADYIYIVGRENHFHNLDEFQVKKAYFDIEFNTDFEVDMRTLDEQALSPITFISYRRDDKRIVFVSLASLSKENYEAIYYKKNENSKKQEAIAEIKKYHKFLKNKKNLDKLKEKLKLDDGIEIKIYPSEIYMLAAFLKFLHNDDPDYISGWNVGFDVTYIITRIKKEIPKLKYFLGEKERKLKDRLLGLLDLYGESSTFANFNNTGYFYKWPGYIVFDLQSHFLKLQYAELPSTSLSYVSSEVIFTEEIEKGDKRFSKLVMPDSMWIKKRPDVLKQMTPQKLFFKNVYNLLLWARYNMRDTDLLYWIDEKLSLIDYFKTLQGITGSPVKYVIHNSKIVMAYIIHMYRELGYVIRTLKVKNTHEKLVGGFTQSSVVGRFNYLVDYDASSMYPSIMRDLNVGWDTEYMKVPYEFAFKYITKNLTSEDLKKKWAVKLKPFVGDIEGNIKSGKMSGENIVKIIKEKKLYISPNGSIFYNHKDKTAITYELLNNLISLRNEYKNQLKELLAQGIYDIRIDNKQKTFKAVSNSFYGVAGFKKFPLGHSDLINAVTYFGRLEIKMVMITINEYLKAKIQNPNLTPDDFNIDSLLPLFKKIDILKQNDMDLDYVRYTDTDGTMIFFDHIVSSVEETDKYMKEINEIINNKLMPFLRNLCNTDCVVKENKFLSFKDEFVAAVGLFYGVSKKYCMKITRKHQKNLPEPEFEIRKNIFPNRIPKLTKNKVIVLLRDHLLHEDYDIDKTFKYINKIREQLYILCKKRDNRLASPVSLRKVIYDYGSVSIPKSVNGMLWYNYLIKEKWITPQKGIMFSIKGFDKDLMPPDILKKYFEIERNDYKINHNGKEITLKLNSFVISLEETLPEWVILDTKKIVYDAWDRMVELVASPIIHREHYLDFNLGF